MQPDREEFETLTRVRDLNHEAMHVIQKIKALEEPGEGVF